MTEEKKKQTTPDAENPADPGGKVVPGMGHDESGEKPGGASLMDVIEQTRKSRTAFGNEESAEGPAKEEEGEAEAGPEDRTPRDESPEEKAYRFKSQEEAEKGYRHLQAEMTRAKQEAARLRKEMEEAREKAERAQRAEQADEEYENYVTERLEQSYAEIDELDDDDEDYQKKVAKINARAQREISQKQRELYGGQDSFARREEAGEPGEPERPEADATAESRTVPAEDRGKIVLEKTSREGIDPANDPVFAGYAAMAPLEMGFEEQVEWAIDKTKEYRAGLKTRDTEVEQPLERGGPGRSNTLRPQKVPDETETTALDRALKDAREMRRLR
jgi:hypothetical protein